MITTTYSWDRSITKGTEQHRRNKMLDAMLNHYSSKELYEFEKTNKYINIRDESGKIIFQVFSKNN
jgi:hypothetical protein